MFKASAQYFKSLKALAMTGICVALYVVLELLAIPVNPMLFIRVGFVMVAVAGMLYGPVVGMTAGAMCDIVAYLVAPKGAYFPGFTFSAAVAGFIYGVFLFRKNSTGFTVGKTLGTGVFSGIIAVVVKALIVDLVLNSFWLYYMHVTSENAAPFIFGTFMISRLIKCAVNTPIECVLVLAFITTYIKNKAIRRLAE